MSRINTEGALRRAVACSAQARSTIVAKMAAEAVPCHHGTRWGQFLDTSRDDSQYGIYGTTAAIEVLVAGGYSTTQPPISDALGGLPLVGGTGTGYTPADTELVFKVASIASATNPGTGEVPISAPAVDRLLEMRVDSRGWGHYVMTDGYKDPHPSMTTTAFSLIALDRVAASRADDRCRLALAWVADQLCAESPNDITDTLGLLALMVFRQSGFVQSRWQEAAEAAATRILGRRQGWEPDHIKKVDYHFPVGNQRGRTDHGYIFFLPDIVAALAFAHWPNRPREAGRFLGSVANAVAEMSAQGGFPAPGSGRIATVDQLWVYRLLQSFEREAERDAVSLLPGVTGTATTKRGRRLIGAGLTVLGGGSLAISIRSGQPWPITAAAGTVSALALGVLAGGLRPFDKR